ncbi:hypothetical protein RB195_022834 [Necator americanus]|uniref:Brinker DNA-binding domain-containing protein n=1 Tax=Necator americanus TaxID=51031 RepID=A0ABR1EJD0_NECAM
MKRRKSYTAAFKLDAINYRDLHGTLAAASHFEVTEAMIRKWVVDRQNLQEMPATKRARRYKKPKKLKMPSTTGLSKNEKKIELSR